MKTIRVVAAIIVKGGKIFATHVKLAKGSAEKYTELKKKARE